jgi:cell division protein FtsQ
VLPARLPATRVPRLVPSLRSVLTGVVLVALAVGAYAIARETSVFAVRTIEIAGGSPAVKAQVRKALAPQLGRSLVSLGGSDVDRRVAAVPGVVSVRYDRVFPHTLRVIVTPERPILLLRRGSRGWVVSARGRVVRAVKNVRTSSLPRVWVARDAQIRVGKILPFAGGTLAASVLAPIASGHFPARVRAVRADGGELTLVLRSGEEVRLGDRSDLRLKLAVARRMLLTLGPDSGATYLDVSVPERPVVGGGNAQVATTA